MKYAFISDIHGNLHALTTVLEHIENENVDQIVCLGDLVGYGAFPNEVIEAVKSVTDIVIAGNHDHAALGLTDIRAFNQYAFQAALWTRKTLTEENRQYLLNLPLSHQEKDLYFVHASPVQPEQWFYIFSDYDAEHAMRYAPTSTVFVGHTHVPRDHRTRRGRLINVGSVGQPRDGNPEAAYTLFDSESGERRLMRVEYDVHAAGKAILEAGLPQFLAERILAGR
ncbi:metallophosphatase family protein [bacterium]|nr:metallophosphatase family protein [bacterium]